MKDRMFWPYALWWMCGFITSGVLRVTPQQALENLHAWKELMK